jgi:hypothetical protein
MDVGCGQKFAATCLDPAFPSPGLTLRAVPIAATVVGDDAMPTAGASIQMAAECSGTTARDGQQDLNMSPANPMAAAPDESNSRGANQIGQLQERPTHLALRLRDPF